MLTRALAILAGVLALAALCHLGLAQSEKGRRLALVVGVNEYDGGLAKLAYAVNDADGLAGVLRSKACGFEVTLLTDGTGRKPTAANIRSALSALLKGGTRRDTVLVALAGHGVQLEVKDKKGHGEPRRYTFFCPRDADLSDVKYNTGASDTMINLDDLFEQLGRSNPGVKLVLMDACRNELKAAGRTRSLSEAKVTVPDGVQALLSCGRRQVAWESDDLRHGLFFHRVIQGLKGAARNRRGEVTWASLTDHVTTSVEEAAEKIGKVQKPAAIGSHEGRTPLLAKIVEEKADVPPTEKGWPNLSDGKNSIGMKLVRIPAKGEKFMMGADKKVDEDARHEEGPRHQVRFTQDFHLGVYTVTQEEFEKVMGYNPSFFSRDGTRGDKGKYFDDPAGGKDKVEGRDTRRLPVENVSWREAVEFCKRLSALEQEKRAKRLYVLPTEAQWELACRGGRGEYKKFGIGKTGSNRLTRDDANFEGSGLGRTRRVGRYEPNAFGLFDMHGNVCQWCADTKRKYEDEAVTDPRGADKEGSGRAFRGGGWYFDARSCRSAYRHDYSPDERYRFLGFRVALTPVR
jgi:formylglycine-generating enzyme required for sulfatase activity